MRKCITCASSYEPNSQDQFYCFNCDPTGVAKPRYAETYELRICGNPGCKREFWVKHYAKNKYCKRECTAEAIKGQRYTLGTKREFHSRKCTHCVICGKEIGAERAPGAITCSKECSKIRNNQKNHYRKKSTTIKPKSSVTAPINLDFKKKDSLSLVEVSVLCAKLHISYGQYQMYSSEQLAELATRYQVTL